MPEVTTTIDKVVDKDTSKGTIFIAHGANGNEYNTKHAGMAKTLKGAAASGSGVSIEFTVLAGRPRDDGSNWPDSLWIDKDGVTVVESSAPASTGGGGGGGKGFSQDDIMRMSRLSAGSSAATLLGAIFQGTGEIPGPDQLKPVADWFLDYGLGRLDAPKTADEALAAAAPADDGIPF